MAETVRITDVSPRDGLQNEAGIIPTADKVRLIELLCATGVDEVEVTSFVSPKWVPQLADAEEVCRLLAYLLTENIGILPRWLSALVPNQQGLESCFAAQEYWTEWFDDSLDDIQRSLMMNKASVFTAASETFCKRNTNATIAESLARFEPVVAVAHAELVSVRGYVSCAIACPFEGPIAPSAVASVASRLVALGVDEIDLGDTIGAGTPETVRALLTAVRSELGDSWWTRERMTLHLHDTFGRAADCVKAALDMGVRSFDGSVAGLGGCPYASTPGKRAPGNISTELLVRTVHAAGYTTGVDLDKLEAAAAFAREIVAKSRASA